MPTKVTQVVLIYWQILLGLPIMLLVRPLVRRILPTGILPEADAQLLRSSIYSKAVHAGAEGAFTIDSAAEESVREYYR